MARSALAVAGALASLLTLSSTALAESPCGGVVISDVVETASGELTAVGERCYERAPGVPYYYDAPSKIEVYRPVGSPASITRFDASEIQALGAQNIRDVANPFPLGQGRADLKPE